MFITFEGIDGSGKGTLLAGVRDWLESRGVTVVCTREPGGTELGKTIRSHLLDSSKGIGTVTEMLLYAADRAHHIESVIRPALESGAVVLCDRYIDSTLAYQGGGRGHSTDMLLNMYHTCCGSVSFWPDITFILDVPVETGLHRANSRNAELGLTQKEGKFEQLGVDFFERVRQNYLIRALAVGSPYTVLDGTLPVDDVLKQAQDAITLKMNH